MYELGGHGVEQKLAEAARLYALAGEAGTRRRSTVRSHDKGRQNGPARPAQGLCSVRESRDARLFQKLLAVRTGGMYARGEGVVAPDRTKAKRFYGLACEEVYHWGAVVELARSFHPPKKRRAVDTEGCVRWLRAAVCAVRGHAPEGRGRATRTRRGLRVLRESRARRAGGGMGPHGQDAREQALGRGERPQGGKVLPQGHRRGRRRQGASDWRGSRNDRAIARKRQRRSRRRPKTATRSPSTNWDACCERGFGTKTPGTPDHARARSLYVSALAQGRNKVLGDLAVIADMGWMGARPIQKRRTA